ncbi:hypothetical protein D1647_19965 [Alistipes sp. Z76]|uniref:hypothetical protein n=5 Tax=Bacteroidales TaxID=171549 RepID=UPI0013715D46|nr:hypothetical protein [Bacteroides caecimuris]NBJ08433.1 hypothetical protein [Alistipes sp. Z76]
MKSDSKIHKFFLGRRGETRMPFGIMLLILVPFLIAGLYFQNRKYNALSANPEFTSSAISNISSIGNSGPIIHYSITVNGIAYDGGAHANGFAVGDSIGVVYQKDNPKNNMTVFEYYDGPSYGAITIFIIVAIAMAVYRWLKINQKYNERCPKLDSSGRCMIYHTDKEYIFVTVYYANSSYPIKFLTLDCDNGAFEDTLTDIFHASLHDKYSEIKASELIKAMKQRSWRQLYMHSTSVLVTHDSHKLKILPTRNATDWDYNHILSFDLDGASWKGIINTIRKLLDKPRS